MEPAVDASHNPLEPHHRNVAGGPARAAVFGVSDGLVTNVSLVLGVAGADVDQGYVRLAGLAGLVAGACSMAAGEYISMRAQKELLERELAMEALQLERDPVVEQQELAALYIQRGIEPDLAKQLAADVMKDPKIALNAHAREELGVDPDSLGSPAAAAFSSFFAFAAGALVPLFPWFFRGGNDAVVASVFLGAVAALLIGYTLGVFTGRSRIWSATRQLLIAGAAAGVTYLIGSVVGVGV